MAKFVLSAGREIEVVTPADAMAIAQWEADREEAIRGTQIISTNTFVVGASGTNQIVYDVHKVRVGYTDHLQRFTLSYPGDSFTSPITQDVRLYRNNEVNTGNLITATVQIPNIYEGASGSDDAPLLFGGTAIAIYIPGIISTLAGLVVGYSLQFRRTLQRLPEIKASLTTVNPDARAAAQLPGQDASLVQVAAIGS